MGASTLNLTPAERQSFAQLYAMADPSGSGFVSGDAAVKFFEGFQLPTLTLGQIWSIADSGNQGYLTPDAFGVALRLIARAQRGESVNEQVVHTPGAPPAYKSGAPPSGGAATITPEDKARFTRIFAMVGPSNGVLSGEQAKDVFLKSKLPYAKLGAIWNLADTKQRGALDLTDFIIGMHYIQGTMNGTISTLPSTLPPGLYEAASEHVSMPSTPLQPQSTGQDYMSGASPLQPPAPSLSMQPPQPQRTATLPQSQSQSQPQSQPQPPSASSTGLATPAAQGGDWAITPADKARYDGFFDSLDTERSGFVGGTVVVPFFLQSGLDESTLAHVWDLADLTQSGALSRDEFAVAMHLINDRIAGKELPQQLPPSLMPPSMRTQALPEAVDVNQTETQRELFSLLDSDVPPTMSKTEAASAFGSAPSAPSMQPLEPQHTRGSQGFTAAEKGKGVANVFDDDFDAPAPAPAPVPVAVPAPNPKIDETRRALETTNKEMDQARERRAAADAAAAEQSKTLGELEAQLARARNAYASEQAALKEVEDKVRAQDEEVAHVRQDVIREESELSALRTQRDELEQKLLQDRESSHELKRKLAELQEETARMREERDRLEQEQRKEAEMAETLNKQLSQTREEVDALSASMAQAQAQTQAVLAAQRKNPFEAFYDSVPVAKDSEPVKFDAQYGFDSFTAAGAGVAAAAGAEHENRAASDEYDTQDEAEGPEAADGVRYYSAERSDEIQEDMNVPGGFPGAYDRPKDTGAASSAKPGMPVQLVDMPPPEPRVPSTGSAALPTQDVLKSSVPASSASTIVAPPSSAPQTPGTGTPAPPLQSQSQSEQSQPQPQPQPLDDFEMAFSHMGLANVVQHTNGGAAAPGTDSFDKDFGIASRSIASSGVPAYLQQSSKVMAPRARQEPEESAGGAAPAPAAAAGASSEAFDDNFSPNKPLSPAQPSEARATTPPLPGDSGPVRQLCHMGFSRTQVIKALERSNYRTERALERLLSQQR